MVGQDLFSLSDRVVVITGAGGLLGQEHALAVGRSGGVPVLLDISDLSLKNAVDRLSEEGIESRPFLVDVTDERDVQKVHDQVVREFGGLWGLVNNVASNPSMTESAPGKDRLETLPLAQWNQDLEVGLTSALICSRIFGGAMNKQGAGSIVNVASDLAVISPDQRMYASEVPSGEEPPVKPVSYSVVKAALLGLTRYLSTYWSPTPVRCNALLPGSVGGSQGARLTQELISRIPLARLAQPGDYQGSLIFLLSDASSYMTGATLVVDGGRTVW